MIAISCSQVGNTLLLGSEAAAAKDQIMLVREEPPSFGFQRLATQSGIYPDLQVFVTKHGLPNFLAETGNRDRKYFILYYLSDREAYACRTRVENREAVEFAGPYPITDKEYRLLDDFRRDPSQKPAKL
ncbi:MAG: hypothetical protein V4689_01715 [Verrucomicrobiota bacterium]